MGSASMESLLLGNKEGSMLFNADPNVCTSLFAVQGGTNVCTILKEPSSVDALGLEGM
jgi:hypothetical protein